MEWSLRWSADPQTLERALALEQQALALDDSLPASPSILGLVYARQQQYDQAMAEGERAIALDPNNADSYVTQADVLNIAGRPEEALRAVEHAMRLNPRYPPWLLIRIGLGLPRDRAVYRGDRCAAGIHQPEPQCYGCPP